MTEVVDADRLNIETHFVSEWNRIILSLTRAWTHSNSKEECHARHISEEPVGGAAVKGTVSGSRSADMSSVVTSSFR